MRLKTFVICWLCLLAVAPSAAGQEAGPPPGGYPWRVVQTLAPVPLPPGGLIPYRQGTTWGYADTTGRVVMQPVLLEEPPFFMADFIGVNLSSIPLLFKLKANVSPFALPTELHQSVGLINGRGEILLLDQAKKEVPLLLPNGSLRAGISSQHLGQPMLRHSPDAGFGKWLPDTVPPEAAAYRHEGRVRRYALGAGRFAANRNYPTRRRPDKNGHRRRRGPTGPRTALADSIGRQLTGWYFGSINPFHDGRALVYDYRPHRYRSAAAPGHDPARATADLLYLDRQGRELRLPPEVAAGSDFAQGTAVLWRRNAPGRHPKPAGLTQAGIIDTLGRWLLPLTSRLQGPDEAGYFRLTQVVRGDTAVRFVTRRARPAGGGQTFRRAGPFFNNRAWVQAADGRQGLIDPQGRWLTTAPDYDLLVSATQRFNAFLKDDKLFVHELPAAVAAFAHSDKFANWQPADTAYMLCRRAGKYGWVARRTGREVIPARYDSVAYYLAEGVACAYRAGQPYLITAQGRELARGQYRGDWYDYPGQPRHLFRPAEGTWSVVDTSGRFRLPWLPGTGCLTPDGRAVVQEAYAPGWEQLPRRQREFPCLGVVDSAGHVVVRFSDGVQYSGRPAAMRLASIAAVHHSPPLFWLSEEITPQPSGVYRVPINPYGLTRLLTTDFKIFTPGVFVTLRLLPNGWHTATRVADTLSVLISPTGGQWAAPLGMVWSRQPWVVGAGRSQQHAQRQPFQYGVEKVLWSAPLHRRRLYELPEGELQEGYLTRGGRQLWAE